MNDTTEATESLPDIVIDEAWSEYVYPRAAVAELSHPHAQSGFMRAMRVLRKWATDHDAFWSGLLKMEQAERDEARRKAAATTTALAYLAAAVRKHGDPNLMNRAQLAELAADLGPQVITHVAAGNCARCGERPMEPGFLQDGQVADVLDTLARILASNPRDWSLDRCDAWLYGVLCGWDCEDHRAAQACDETCTNALASVAERHGWNAVEVDVLRKMRATIREVRRG